MSVPIALASGSMTSPRPLPIAQQMPHEILSAIFNLVSEQTSGHLLAFTLLPETAISARPGLRHNEVMRSLALVCKNWHIPATEVLYGDLTIARPGQLPDLVAHAGRCLPFVRHIRVLWNRQPWVLPQDPDLAIIPQLLDLCQNVDRLTLAGEQFDLSSPDLLASLRRRSSPHSTSLPVLRLSCCAIETPFFHQRFGPQGRRTSSTIGLLLLACPSLVEVRCDEFRSAYGSAPVPPALEEEDPGTILAPKLEKFAFQRVVLESRNLERLLCPLEGQLKELYLDRTSLATCESWRMILSKVGTELEVLELKDCDFWATWEVDASSPPLIDATLLSCPRLRHLVLLGSLDSLPPSFSTPHETLKSLTVGCRFINTTTLARAIRKGMFPALKMLHVEATCEWTDEGEAVVQKACVDGGVLWKTGWNLD